MNGFRVFLESELERWYPSLYPIEILIEARRKIDFEKLISQTDSERLRKAVNEVRSNPPTVSDYVDGSEKLDFNFKAFPSKEMRRHKGFIIHNEGVISRLYCDCKDFFYRLWAPLFEAGLAKYELPSKLNTEFARSHNQEWPNIRNPKGALFCCKHLAALKDYL